MSTPTELPPVPPVPTVQADILVVEVSTKVPLKVRAKMVAKKLFARVGVPALIGTSAYFVTQKLAKPEESAEEPVEPVVNIDLTK